MVTRRALDGWTASRWESGRVDDRHQQVWESLGTSDPDWAVLTDPELRGRGWEPNLDEFYDSGRRAVEGALALLPPDALPSHSGVRVLDFGCGTGRLSLALAARGMHVTAVDVAPSMLATTMRRAQERGHAERITPVQVGELAPAADHDLVLSLLVLQHLPGARAIEAAVSQLVRCVRPGGWLLLELPDRASTWKAKVQPRWQAFRALRRLGVSPATLQARRLSGISMTPVAQSEMTRWLERAGAEVVSVHVTQDVDYQMVRYVARRGT